MRISVIAPIKNEAQFVGYSIMSCHKQVEEFVYAVAPSSNDGTIDILRHIAKHHGKVRLLIDPRYDFEPMDTVAYNKAYQDCIDQARGDACWFLHPDMVVTKWTDPAGEALAWWTNVTSYARDFNTVITKGRCDKWKNIHRKKFGLKYLGGYGSTNEDFYHSEITGKSLKHFGTDFWQYPYEVADSGIDVAHFCELKPYKRRLEKMKLCLKTQHPTYVDKYIQELAENHPRVTLEPSCEKFGQFEFGDAEKPLPDVFTQYKQEFDQFQKKEEVLLHG